jgi:hypothetical protein
VLHHPYQKVWHFAIKEWSLQRLPEPEGVHPVNPEHLQLLPLLMQALLGSKEDTFLSAELQDQPHGVLPYWSLISLPISVLKTPKVFRSQISVPERLVTTMCREQRGGK